MEITKITEDCGLAAIEGVKEIASLVDDDINELEQIQNIRKNIKLDLDSDLGFQSSINTLVSSQVGQMQKNRIISNLIEKGIEKGLILENCK